MGALWIDAMWICDLVQASWIFVTFEIISRGFHRFKSHNKKYFMNDVCSADLALYTMQTNYARSHLLKVVFQFSRFFKQTTPFIYYVHRVCSLSYIDTYVNCGQRQWPRPGRVRRLSSSFACLWLTDVSCTWIVCLRRRGKDNVWNYVSCRLRVV